VAELRPEVRPIRDSLGKHSAYNRVHYPPNTSHSFTSLQQSVSWIN